MKRMPRLCLLALLAGLAGCAGAPDYQRPAITIPPSWQSSTLFQVAAPGDGAGKGNWWELFQDARLNQLVQQALTQNQNLRVAAARLEQARAQVAVSSAGLFPALGLQAGGARQKSSAERAVAAANANIGVARAAYFPNIQLQTSGGWNSVQLSTLLSAPSILWSLGVAATQTLFDAGKTDAGVRIAEASYTASVASYRQSVLLAMQEVEDGISGLALLGRARAQAEASVHSAQRVLDLANERYSGGVATYLDVITAQQALFTNQRQLVQIQGRQMLTSAFLVKALGGGWQEKS